MKTIFFTIIPFLFFFLFFLIFQGFIPNESNNPFVPESCKVKLCTNPPVSGHFLQVKNSSGVVVASCYTQADGCCSADGNFNCLETHYAYDYTLDCYHPISFVPQDASVVYVSSNCP